MERFQNCLNKNNLLIIFINFFKLTDKQLLVKRKINKTNLILTNRNLIGFLQPYSYIL